MRGQILLESKVFLQKLQASSAGVLPDFIFETVAGSRINFDFVRNSLFFQQLLQVVRLFDGDGRIGLAVQDEDRSKASHEELHLPGQASEELDYHFHTRVNGGVGE